MNSQPSISIKQWQVVKKYGDSIVIHMIIKYITKLLPSLEHTYHATFFMSVSNFSLLQLGTFPYYNENK